MILTKMTGARWFWAGILAACVTAANGAPALTLVADGKAEAAIVIPDRPSPAAAAGAELLGDLLFRMSGARLKMIREGELAGAKAERKRIETAGEPAASVFILVGEGTLARQLGATSEALGPGGIRIKTFGNALVLLGPDAKTPSDPWGTHYAVTTFLDETLGCKYLWPTETGLVVPSRKTIQVPALDVQVTPLLRQRYIRSMGYNNRLQQGLDVLRFTREDFLRVSAVQAPNWFRWHRLGGTLGLAGGDGTVLSQEAWGRFRKEHPEWFAMQADGSREQAPNETRPRLCLSNPQLVEAIVQEKLKELKAHPGQSSVSLMVNDGGYTGFCLCPACKAMDPKDGRPIKFPTYNHAAHKIEWIDYVSLTDRMVSFYNAIAEQVAREYPNVLFVGQAYSIYAAPPVRTKLRPNIVIRFVGPNLYFRDAERRQGLADWDAWARAASKLFYRPNLLALGKGQGTPMIYVHKLARDFRHLARTGMLGTDFDSCMHSWATQGLNYYILAKLHWNPDLDVDRAIDDYCRAGFGAGGPAVRKYLARLEQLTDRIAAKELAITQPYTPEVIAELRGYLDAAEKAARGDEAVQRRIAFLRCGLDYTDLQAQVYRMLARAQVKPPTAEEKGEAVKLLDRRWRRMRRMFLEEPYAVNVGYVCRSEGHPFAVLGWSGPSAAATTEEEADEAGRPVEPAK